MRNLSAVLFAMLAIPAAALDWPPPDPSELAMRTPQIEPGADAEALLWDVRVAHEIEGGWVRTELSHYLRVKVFTEAGRDRLGTVDIPYGTNHRVANVAGRTIRPDGSIVELQKDSVYDRTIAKVGSNKANAKSFALPGLQVGSIIEYRWDETIEDHITNYFRLQFQRDLPIHTVRYHVKPIRAAGFPYAMGSLSLNFKVPPLAKEKDGFFGTSATLVPSFKEERDMPPEAAVRPWMLIFYADMSEPPERYWQATGKSLYDGYHDRLKVNGEMREAALTAVKGAEGDEARLSRLFDFVVREFKNDQYESDDDHTVAREAKENRTALDTWKQKAGSGYDITLLFLALAGALDYDARLAMVAHQDFGPFDKRLPSTYFLRSYDVAVKVGGAWTFCDPGSPFLPFGMLPWNEQGQAALIADPKQAEVVTTPIASPEASLTQREGRFRLSANGDLEGDVRLVYTGHAAWGRRYGYRRQSQTEREEAVRQSIKDRYAGGEVSEIVLDGVPGVGALTVSYRVKVPGYAQRTGRRLFLQCAFFSRGGSARYESEAPRRHPISYANAWSERDAFTFQLPDGYTLESPEAPGGFKVAESGQYDARITVTPDQHAVRYERAFDFGRGGRLRFPREAYPKLKQVFDQMHELDNHTLALRQAPK